MILCGVVEPESLEEKNFEGDLYGEGMKQFLQNIIRRGVIVIDSDKVLKSRLRDKVQYIPPKYQPAVTQLLSELFKMKNRVVACNKTKWKNSSIHTIGDITKFNAVDGVFCRPNQVKRLKDQYVSARDRTSSFGSYFNSPFEERNKDLESRPSSIKKLSEYEFEGLLRPVLRHTSTLSFFDQYIGKGSSPSNFERGISLIVRAWNRSSNIPAAERKINIYTLTSERVYKSPPNGQRSKSQSMVEDAIENVQDKVVRPLIDAYNVPINLNVKQANSPSERKDAHARYLETDNFIIHFERGFDIFHSDGGFCDTPVRLDNTAARTTQWWRNLPDYYISTGDL